MKYIYTRSKGINEVIEATMEKPKCITEHHEEDCVCKECSRETLRWHKYNNHLSTAPRYPIEGEIPDSWKEGDEMDVRLQCQWLSSLKWFDCSEEKYNDIKNPIICKRIVAIPIYQSQCTCNFTTEFIKGKADCPVHDVAEETEYELWKELIDTFDTEDTKSYGYASLIKELKSRFILIRKPNNNEFSPI